jgi:uncharacterized membrane protein YgaE (UPF0421/DUF939 family)
MKKIDLGQTLRILGNVGVLIGILLLVYELNQNRDLMRAQTRNELQQGLTDVLSLTVGNIEVADIVLRANRGDELTGTESLIFAQRSELVFRYWENVHYQYRQGLYDEVEFSKHLRTMETVVGRSDGLADFWCENRALYSAPFAAEIDAIYDTSC